MMMKLRLLDTKYSSACAHTTQRIALREAEAENGSRGTALSWCVKSSLGLSIGAPHRYARFT
jgi:hypothetical protein